MATGSTGARPASGRRRGATSERTLSHAERGELINVLTRGRHQQLLAFLRRDTIQGLRVNERFCGGVHDGQRPLHVAASRGDARHVTMLIEEADARPDVRVTHTGDTPLHLAAEKGHVAVARVLLAARATTKLANREGYTALHCAAHHAEPHTEHAVIAADLAADGAPLLAQDDAGDTPVHVAVDNARASVRLIGALCAASEDVAAALGVVNGRGEAPLHRAAARGDVEAAAELLRHSADVNVRTAPERNTPLHTAARRGDAPMVALLLAQPAIEVNATNLAGENPMHCALCYRDSGHAEVARVLLGAGAVAVASTLTGEGALHLCAREGNVELARKMLAMPCGGGVNAVAADGTTPLHVACAYGQREMVAALLDAPGIDRTARDARGLTAVHLAVTRGNGPLLRLLLRAAAAAAGGGAHASDASASLVDELTIRNKVGWTALHTAAFGGDDASLVQLLEAGMPPDAPSADGAAALHLAAARGHEATARALLLRGASVDPRQAGGETPLALAAIRRDASLVRLLLEHGAAVRSADVAGWSAVHTVLWDESHELARLLLGTAAQSAEGAPAVEPRGSAEVSPLHSVGLHKLPAGEPESHAPPAVKQMLALQRGGGAAALEEEAAVVGVY